MRGRFRIGTCQTIDDPWRDLTAAVLERAIDDAKGYRLYAFNDGGRAQLIVRAQRWLLSDEAAALFAALDLEHDAVLDALTRPEKKKGTPNDNDRHDLKFDDRRRRNRQPATHGDGAA